MCVQLQFVSSIHVSVFGCVSIMMCVFDPGTEQQGDELANDEVVWNHLVNDEELLLQRWKEGRSSAQIVSCILVIVVVCRASCLHVM